MAEPSSSSFQPISSPANNIAVQYDVFVSFRGEDVRNNFVSHLQAAFKRKGITTFFDEELKRGQQISPALLKAIQQSSISVVVFSENYASSRWCLDELLKIVECRNTYGQIVLPVFYHVDPSNVRNQTGIYAEAFAKHQQTREQDEIQKWRDALTEVANLSGLDSANWRLESEMIDKITQEILKKLDRLTLNNVDGVVGIEVRVERIESCLRLMIPMMMFAF
ncbi:disease resistance protein RLM3-like [Benincasa hispida]|uniref:disease resistance protein RLM3-like n=1 Tax=Benincasa hispida TaxID=102211 RepID=UPI0019026E95|nr:disease resistance protein RLM3-like [Benincasa hispida]XP_038876490.1 disease resistance protein RLM3-like [Benincasa hispida]